MLAKLLDILRGINENLGEINRNMMIWQANTQELLNLLKQERHGLPDDFPFRDEFHDKGIMQLGAIPRTANRLKELGFTMDQIVQIDRFRRQHANPHKQ